MNLIQRMNSIHFIEGNFFTEFNSVEFSGADESHSFNELDLFFYLALGGHILATRAELGLRLGRIG